MYQALQECLVQRDFVTNEPFDHRYYMEKPPNVRNTRRLLINPLFYSSTF